MCTTKLPAPKCVYVWVNTAPLIADVLCLQLRATMPLPAGPRAIAPAPDHSAPQQVQVWQEQAQVQWVVLQWQPTTTTAARPRMRAAPSPVSS
jgi:hypothetical protein